MELLDKQIIEQYLDTKYRAFSDKIVILDEVSSTNAYLIELSKIQANNINICFAESQFAGRGRLGRGWHSPYARNIYLSIRWKFAKEVNELSGLSIAIAVALARTLDEYGIKKGITLKWPNDVLWQSRKLAGILIEFLGGTSNPYQAVIGVGLNVNMSQQSSQEIKQPWCDITEIIDETPQRNKLAGLLLNTLLSVLDEFQANGLKSFLNKWRYLDSSYGKKVTIIMPQQQTITGIGCGIDDRGLFLLKDSSNKIQAFAVGELSLRLYC